jgi:hypothetical protein
MEDVPEVCLGCGQGTLIDEVLTEYPDNSSEAVYYYSCGHRHFRDVAEATLFLSVSVGTVLKSGVKVRGKPVQVIDDRTDHSDRDHPELPVTRTIYIHRSSIPEETSVFHAVAYDSGLKHLDCKRKGCNNHWVISGDEPLENHFDIEIGKATHIRCLKCGASFTRP